MVILLIWRFRDTLAAMAIEDPTWPRADVWLASEDAHPDLLVAGFPTAAASLSPSRADLAPRAVRQALSRFSTFHGEWEDDLAGVRVRDAGNADIDVLDMFEMPPAAEAYAAALPSVPLTVYLGGDNAITRPLVRAAGDLDGLGVLTFDAHHDARPTDRGPTNGSPIRGLIAEDGLPGNHVAQIGIQGFSNSIHQRRWCEDRGVSVYPMSLVDAWGIDEVVSVAFDTLTRTCSRVYVDVDVDVLDRAFAPGCPGSRPGGMTVRDLTLAVRRCGAHPAVRWMDIVEVDPERDIDGLTVDAAAMMLLSAAAGLAERIGRDDLGT